MNQIPDWWLILSGVFFALVAILFLVLCVLVVSLIKVVSSLQKPITGLVAQVNDLVPTVKSLVQKVEDLTEKVEGIADSTRSTVDIVGHKAQGIATSVEHISSIASQRMAQFAPILGTLMAGARLYSVYRQFRATSTDEEGQARKKYSRHKGTKIDLGEAPEE